MRGSKPETGIVNRCPLLFAGRMCFIPSGVPETAESIAYFRGTVKCYRGSKKIGIVALDLKSRKKEFLNRYTRRMWNSRVRYVITSKGRRVVKWFHPTTLTPPMGADPLIRSSVHLLTLPFSIPNSFTHPAHPPDELEKQLFLFGISPVLISKNNERPCFIGWYEFLEVK